jgi:hypothetical protein
VLLRIGADMIKSLEWDIFFSNKDNFLFYPHEEIVRFINRFVIKRVDVVVDGIKELCRATSTDVLLYCASNNSFGNI